MIGFYSDRGSICAKFRKQKDGKKVSLTFYPGISDEGFNKETKRFKDQALQKKITAVENAIFFVTEKNDPFKLTNESFAQLINEHLTGKKPENTPFFDYCERYFTYFSNTYTRRRAQTIRTCISKVKEFDPGLTFEKIDKRFFRDFIQHCNDKGYATNYTGSIIRDLKRILNYATDNDENVNTSFKSFKKPMEEVFNIYLTSDEIQKIYDLQITPNAVAKLNEEKKSTGGINIGRQIVALEKARKLFVIGCCTGLRVENYLSIDPDIQVDLKKGFIHAIANKNGPKLKIPLHKLVREIYSSGGWPEPMSQQKLNEHIKQLGQLAGISEQVIFTRTKGNKRVEYVLPKYKLIVSHTARRSFCSNLIQSGVPARYVMAVSGHKTESSFNKYVQSVQKDILTAKLKDYDVWG